jgi:hypothetical protein
MPENNSLTRCTPLFKLTALELWTPFLTGFFDPFSLYNYCSPLPGEHFFAGVAQLVEQLIRNQQVSGSSPLAGFPFGH